MSTENLARIKAVRAGNRAVITKLTKETEHILKENELDEGRLQTIGAMLNDKLAKIKELDSQVQTLCEVTEIMGEIEESEDIISRILDTQRHIKDGIERVTIKLSAPEEFSTGNLLNEPSTSDNYGENSSVNGAILNTATTHENEAVTMETMSPPVPLNSTGVSQVRPKLPKLVLSKFKGNVADWTGFWDSYQVAVHDNPLLSSIDKFNYLNSLLEGPAARAIQGLSLTSGNYDHAIAILKKRFGKPQRVITSHMDELLKIPSCNKERPSSLRYVYDKISIHVRGPESLGVSADQYGSLLIPIIMDKLPSKIKLQITRKVSGEVWKINELLDTIRVEVEAREASDASTIHNTSLNSHKTQRPAGTANTLFSNDGKIRCVYCHGEHFSASCKTMVNAKDRKDALRKAGRCFICLNPNHMSRDCNSTRNCRHCNNKHHQSICEKAHGNKVDTKPKSGDEQDQESNSVTTASATKGRKDKTVLLQTARATAINKENNRSVPVRILFDNGSQRSYVTDDVSLQLGLKPIKKEKLKLNTFGESRYKTQNCDIVNLQLKKPQCDDVIDITATSYPVICAPLPSKVNVECPHLEELDLADDWESSDGSIDILVGSDYYWDIVIGETRHGTNSSELVAVSSKLGWLLSGPVQSSMGNGSFHSNLIVAKSVEGCHDFTENDEGLTKTLRPFWETEAIGITDIPCDSEATPFITEMNHDGNRYEVGLPWKENRPGTHYELCYNRLKSLQRRLKVIPDLLHEYDSIIKEQLQGGVIEKIPKDELIMTEIGTVHYMPHHSVVRTDKDTTKLRVVYDGSAKPKPDELSINECLEQGPNLIPKLFDLLIKFRSNPIALTADIEKAFLMIGISKSDRDMLRFMWFNDPNNLDSEISHFRFARLVFGLRPSPAILGSILAHHLNSYKDRFPELIKMIEESLYVDDLISGGENESKAFAIYEFSKRILAEGSFNLRKWHSNSVELLDRIHQAENRSEMQAKDDMNLKPITEEDHSYTKSTICTETSEKEADVVNVLGTKWNCKTDELCFNLSGIVEYATTLPVTKRSLLKITVKIFDPLGLLSPFVIRLKCLFQVVCLEKRGWDDPLQGNVLDVWNRTIAELEALNAVRIPRCYFDSHLHATATQLHAFSDASNTAYAAVVYTRSTYKNGDLQVRLVASKSRVAPIKKQSIPRLELLGAVILARLVNTLKGSIPGYFRIFYLVDSMTVLCWIKNDKVWKQYVSHRVEEIRRLTTRDDWRHCPGTTNPADLPSRGMSGSDLSTADMWWNGPQFLLLTESEWPVSPSTSSIDAAATVELVKNQPSIVHVLPVTTCGENPVDISKIINCERYSSLTRLVRVTAYVLRFVRNGRNSIRKIAATQEVSTRELTAEKVSKSEFLWIRSVQSVSFIREIEFLTDQRKHNTPVLVRQFGLVLDEQEILRCKGRIDEADMSLSSKTPALLSPKHWFTELVIRDTHKRVKHSGIRNTLAAIREVYWILRGREAVKKSLRHCVVCRKVEGVPYKPPTTPELPEFRVSDAPPFSHTGLDFAGPLYIKDTSKERSRESKAVLNKVYVLLLTCAATRAVHLELTRGLDVPTFLLAIRRFVARRGLPASFISDNAKTFKSASKDLKKVIRSQEFTRYMTENRVHWKFIVDKAPWWGGFWERLVKTVKLGLKKTIGRATVTYDELATILTEVESVINARPITYVYDGEESVSYALTPSHLINGRMITAMPNDHHYEIVSTSSTLSRRAKHQRNILRRFINQWRRDYLLNLRENSTTQSRCSANSTVNQIAKGDIVLLKSDSSARNFWQLAIIEEFISSRDGKIRAAVVKTINGQGKPSRLRRVIQHLIPLEIHSKSQEYHSHRDSPVGPSARVRRDAAIAGELRRIEQSYH